MRHSALQPHLPVLQHEGWQRAREGLAAGRAPVLASSGTGGSYFIPDFQGKQPVVLLFGIGCV